MRERVCGTELMETIAKYPKERLGILTAETPTDYGVWYLLVLLISPFKLNDIFSLELWAWN